MWIDIIVSGAILLIFMLFAERQLKKKYEHKQQMQNQLYDLKIAELENDINILLTNPSISAGDQVVKRNTSRVINQINK